MKKIRSIEDFTSFRNAVLNGSENNVPCLIISAGTCGQASGANDIMRMSKRYILEKNHPPHIGFFDVLLPGLEIDTLALHDSHQLLVTLKIIFLFQVLYRVPHLFRSIHIARFRFLQ